MQRWLAVSRSHGKWVILNLDQIPVVVTIAGQRERGGVQPPGRIGRCTSLGADPSNYTQEFSHRRLSIFRDARDNGLRKEPATT